MANHVEPIDRSEGREGTRDAAAERDDVLSRQLEKAVETMQVGVTVTDTQRKIVYVNPAEAAMHGYEVEELLGRESSIFAPPELWQPMQPQQLYEVRSWKRESVNIRKDGTRFPVEILSDVVIGREGEPIGVVSISRDISERQAAERALRESEERYALALRGANDGIWDWHLETDHVFFSPRWHQMLGLQEGEIEEHVSEWLERVHPDDRRLLDEALEQHLAGDSEHLECEHRMRHADGSYRLVLCRGLAVRDERGSPYRMAGSLTDVTERKGRDPLTGLPNRALFLDRLGSSLARAQRRPDRLTVVLFLDLDRFKLINDSFGHVVGDQVLVSVARRIETSLRPGDTLARIGGDEMTVLLEEMVDLRDAEVIARRIHQRLQQPFHFGDMELYVTVSIGIAASTTGLDDPVELLNGADCAMYQAKSEGRGRTSLFDVAMRQQAAVQLQLESELRQAMQEHQLEVHYQPIISLSSKRLIGFEALIRWRHPQRGLLLPEDFIAAAEETGLIVGVGRWVLREACEQLHTWHREFPATRGSRMHVNLSARQFANPDLTYHVDHALQCSGLAPRHLVLEITESTLIDSVKAASQTIETLRELGVRVCIDDFGTGYSSLRYLQKLPVSGLKIDRSFVRQIDEGGKNVELVHTIIQLARELDIEVVAEGVETDGELRTLEGLACDLFQGFWHSRPDAPDQLRSLLESLDE